MKCAKKLNISLPFISLVLETQSHLDISMVWDRTTSDYEWISWCTIKLLCSNKLWFEILWVWISLGMESPDWPQLDSYQFSRSISLTWTAFFSSSNSNICTTNTRELMIHTNTQLGAKRLPTRVVLSAFFLPFSNKISHDRTKKLNSTTKTVRHMNALT